MKKIITMGEIMLRLTPENHSRIVQADSFAACYGGSEANVGVALASMGFPVEYVTALPDNPLGRAVTAQLQMHGVGTGHIAWKKGRLGLFFAENGAGIRPSRIVYDRAGSAFALSEMRDYDWDRVFADAGWLHLSGITPALGGACMEITEQAMKAAKIRGITISFDLNYRTLLWNPEEAERAMDRLLPYVDVFMANDKDVYGIYDFDYRTDEGDVKARAEEICRLMTERYGFGLAADISLMTDDRGGKCLAGVLLKDGKAYCSSELPRAEVSRIGAGDAFCAGLIAGLNKEYPEQRCIDIAAVTAAMKYSIPGDFDLITFDEVLAAEKGGGSGISR